VFLPLSVPLPPPVFKLMPESLGAGGGMGFLPPATGLFEGGAGGVGFARTADPFVPLDRGAAGGGGGVGRAAGATGGGGGASSLT
jgi:hypothetical protein